MSSSTEVNNKKSVAIMQPTFIPWIGYLDLIDQVDEFVFLDNVQFEKQSWQQRNQIRTSNGLEWITVPVFIKGRFGQLLQDVEIQLGKFPKNHIKQIHQNYSKAPFYQPIIDQFEESLYQAAESGSLCTLNISLIDWLCDYFSINTPRIRASSLGGSGKRSQRLIGILEKLNATKYISPRGSAEYLLQDMALFREIGITVKLAGFNHPSYQQIYSPFIPFASAIDLAFNVGEDGLSLIRSGRQSTTLLENT